MFSINRVARQHMMLTAVIVILALVGEVTLMHFLHSFLDSLGIPYILDIILDATFIVAFVAPLFYFYRAIGKNLKATFTDHLTGIHNRKFFNEYHAVLSEKKKPYQLLLLDLCKFKEVNDKHGHQVGDEVLKIVANKFTNIVGKKGYVARLGGDEFVILLEGTDEENRVAQEIAHAASSPMFIHDIPLKIGVSIGIAKYPSAGTDTNTLLAKADCAMYVAKQNEIDYFVHYHGDSCCTFRPKRNNR